MGARRYGFSVHLTTVKMRYDGIEYRINVPNTNIKCYIRVHRMADNAPENENRCRAEV